MADDSREIVIPYQPRAQFQAFHDRTQRWAVLVAHRRAGKTVACVNELQRAALLCRRERPRFAYIAPLLKQAKTLAWDYLLHYSAPIPGIEVNHSELRVDYPNGGQVRLWGADNPDAMRGVYLDGVVMDEPAQMHPRMWSEILRPALSDRHGWAVWIGTPKGKNDFWKIWDQAKNGFEQPDGTRKIDPNWMAVMLRASDTGLLDPAELADARKSMSQDEYDQEYECSFDAAIQGAYYGILMREAEEAKRITRVPHSPDLQVYTAWDLGIGDQTVIWFAQLTGAEVRIIDCYAASGVGLDHYTKILKEGHRAHYQYAEHILPHDAMVADLSTGKSRVQVLGNLGISPRVLEREGNVDDGINTVRMMLPRCWFDAERCATGIEALKQYRCEFDEDRKVFKNRPLHDWTSDYADAFRYLARGLPGFETPRKPKQRYGWGGGGETSWMSS
jgi:phage terminase large subunit